MRAYKIVPWSEIKTASLSKDALRRLIWLDWYYSHGRNAERTCRHFSISKSLFYRWLGRFDKYSLKTLEFDTKTRRPHKVREMTTPLPILQKIYSIREADLSKSKYEIHEELKREGIGVAHNVIQKVINRHSELHNLSKNLSKQKRKYSIARTRAPRELRDKSLGSLIQIDTKHLYILGKRYYVFVAIDCRSRLGFVQAYTTISSKSAADFLGKVANYFPFPIEAINTDNGSEYLLNFHKLITDLAIPHYFSYPHTPKMNARVERLIQTLIYEFINLQEDLIPEIDHLRLKCQEFNYWYNHRYHQSLGYQTPSEYVTTLLSKGGQTVLYV